MMEKKGKVNTVKLNFSLLWKWKCYELPYNLQQKSSKKTIPVIFTVDYCI